MLCIYLLHGYDVSFVLRADYKQKNSDLPRSSMDTSLSLEYIRLSGTFRPVTYRYSSSEISTESAVQAYGKPSSQ